MLVPWLLIALADARSSHPAMAGRLKAAALQLLPPLLDGLNVRRISSILIRRRGAGMERQDMQSILTALVGTMAQLLRAPRLLLYVFFHSTG